MATNKPDETVRDAMQKHREKEHLRGNVEEAYEKTLSYIPEAVEPYVSPGLGPLGYSPDDYISIDKRNYDNRIEPEVEVLVTFGSGGGRGTAEATVLSETEQKNDDVTIDIAGHEFDVKGWQIKGVLRSSQ